MYSEMQKQATEGLFRELEITIEQGRFEESAHKENTPHADLSQRIVRLSLDTNRQIPDGVSRCDRSVVAALLEEQVKYLTSERDKLLEEHRAALQKQLEEHQQSLNHLAKERVEYERNLGEIEGENEDLLD